MSDADFLDWVADRLVNVHGENPNIDFVLKLRRMASGQVYVTTTRPDRVIWPEGCPEEAVRTKGYLSREWHKFRLGWSLNPSKLRRVHEATSKGYENPVMIATLIERALA